MAEPTFDVLGIGNAVVDVIATTEEDFLVREHLIKGSMRLIETDEAERLYGLMGGLVGIHWSLGLSAVALLAVTFGLSRLAGAAKGTQG